MRKIPLVEKPNFASGSAVVQDDGEREEDPAVDEHLETIRTVIKTDRAIHDKASHRRDYTFYGSLMSKQSVMALVSFVRAYSKHEASFIFRVKDLDLVGVAKSYGLLRLPRMPELKALNLSNWTSAEIDVSFILFSSAL